MARAFGVLELAGPGGQVFARVECDEEGELAFELVEQFEFVRITGEQVFGEFARLQSRVGELDYGEVRLRTRGRLRVDVLGVSSNRAGLVQIGIRHPSETPGGAPGFGVDVEAEIVAGAARAELIVEAQRPLYISLSRDGLRRSFVDRQVEVAPGGVESLSFDLSELCALTGRVVGLPTDALAGRGVELLGVHALQVESDMNALAAPRVMRARSILSGDGAFAFDGLDRAPVQVSLDLGAERVPLVVEGAAASALAPCESLCVRLAPAEPIVAVALFDRGGRQLLRAPMALGFGRKPLGRLIESSSGHALVRRAELERAGPFVVFAVGYGWARIDDPIARIDGDVLLRLTPEDFVQPEGELVVEFSAPLSTGERLVCRPLAGSVGAFGNDPDFESATRVEREENRTVFHALPAGTYELLWSRKGQVRAADRVEHDGRRVTRLRLAPPRVFELRGRVESTSPDGSTAALEVAGVRFEGRRFVVRGGEFAYDGFESTETGVEVELASRLRLPAVCEYDAEFDELRVTVAADAQRVLAVEPVFGGRIVAEPWPYVSSCAAPQGGAGYVQSIGAGLLQVERFGPRAVGRIWEIGDEFKRLRGWFGAEPGAHAETFAGRLVELCFVAPSGPARVFAFSESDLLGAPVALVSTSASSTLWLPLSARALRIEFANARSVEVEVNGARVVVPQY